jgi:uncharacterized membrane protein YfcA
VEALLPEGVTGVAAAGLTAASFFTSLISAALGLGGGVLLLAIMAAVMPASAIIPVHAVVQLGSNLGRAVLMVGHVDRAALPAFAAGSALGAFLGGAVAVDLPPEGVRLAVGLFILWTLVAKPPAFLRRAAFPAGAASSFLSMFFGATGPFTMAYVRTRELGRMGTVATHAGFMTLQHLLKIAAFGLFGFAFAPWTGLVAAMIVAGLAGTWAGGRVLTRLPERAFRIALQGLLALIALQLVWEGATGLSH